MEADQILHVMGLIAFSVANVCPGKEPALVPLHHRQILMSKPAIMIISHDH